METNVEMLISGFINIPMAFSREETNKPTSKPWTKCGNVEISI